MDVHTPARTGGQHCGLCRVLPHGGGHLLHGDLDEQHVKNQGRESNLDLPITGNSVSCESDTLACVTTDEADPIAHE
uniref:Uncharacterized protein n=2 Tax=Timema TaxID=61471 RepID=A0A7R9FER7_9NEOP|nr:unnamed protein product [Timema bartmani]CAD7452228.1 unnamed protein product [Timema tahoe]